MRRLRGMRQFRVHFTRDSQPLGERRRPPCSGRRYFSARVPLRCQGGRLTRHLIGAFPPFNLWLHSRSSTLRRGGPVLYHSSFGCAFKHSRLRRRRFQLPRGGGIESGWARGRFVCGPFLFRGGGFRRPGLRRPGPTPQIGMALRSAWDGGAESRRSRPGCPSPASPPPRPGRCGAGRGWWRRGSPRS